ncbi:MAG: hypothetical protein ACR2F6_15500 [Mycobacteriales bacterium]
MDRLDRWRRSVEDLFGGLGPDEWFRVLVPGVDLGANVFLEGGLSTRERFPMELLVPLREANR